MSGAAVPYRLRPHKSVDRRLFLEVLNRCQRWVDLSDHAYVSMAAYSLEDQKLVHRLLGITRLFAFDMDAQIVARQMFNRPTGSCKCENLKSGDLTADVAGALEKAGIDDAEGYIVWLDYTSPREIFSQLQEFEKLLGQYRPNDIVRVTVNAEFGSWAGPDRKNGKSVEIERRQRRARELLKEALGEYFPEDIVASQIGPDGAGVALILARAFAKAAGRALPARDGTALEPLSITRYADGQQMLSMTGIVVDRSERDKLRTKLGLADWYFSSKEWTDIKFLAVPDLTLRERLFLERNAEVTAAEIKRLVGFDFDQVTGMSGFLKNFRAYYRHYPALTPVEV